MYNSLQRNQNKGIENLRVVRDIPVVLMLLY